MLSLQRSYRPNILNHFLHAGGLQVLKRCMTEFEEAGQVELLEMAVRTLLTLPADGEAIRECGIGKVINRLRRGGEPPLNDLSDQLVIQWRVLTRAKRALPQAAAKPRPGASEDRTKRPRPAGGDGVIPRKKRAVDILGDALSAPVGAAPTRVAGASNVALKAAEAKKARIAQRRFGGAGGTVKVSEGSSRGLAPSVPKRVGYASPGDVPRGRPAGSESPARLGRSAVSSPPRAASHPPAASAPPPAKESPRKVPPAPAPRAPVRHDPRVQSSVATWKALEAIAAMVPMGDEWSIKSTANNTSAPPPPEWVPPRVLDLVPPVPEDEFDSPELARLNERNAEIQEVFLARRGMPQTPSAPSPAATESEDAGTVGAVPMIPLHSTADVVAMASAGRPEEVKLMLGEVTEEQREEIKAQLPEDVASSGTAAVPGGESGIAMDELPEAFQQLPPQVIAYLANNEQLVSEILTPTGEIDHAKLAQAVGHLLPPGTIPARGSAATTAPLPVGAGQPQQQVVVAVEVEFKRGRRERFAVSDTLAVECAKYSGPFSIVVDCQPGMDLGTVVQLLGPNSAGDTAGLRMAVRVASERERLGLRPKAAAEANALQEASSLVAQLGMAMTIEDTEFQFDKRRITIFYRSTHRVDFRDFVGILARKLSARVWMERA